LLIRQALVASWLAIMVMAFVPISNIIPEFHGLLKKTEMLPMHSLPGLSIVGPLLVQDLQVLSLDDGQQTGIIGNT
jgi:hypothetical protein